MQRDLRRILPISVSMLVSAILLTSASAKSEEAGGTQGTQQAAAPQQQFNLISPQELATLKQQAQQGLDSRSKETLRHMYTAAALTGLLANQATARGDVITNIELAKAYGYAMIKAQEKDTAKRDARAAKK